MEHIGVPAQPGRGGGDGPGEGPGDTRQQSLSEHPDLKHQTVCEVCGAKQTKLNKYKFLFDCSTSEYTHQLIDPNANLS